MFANLQRRIFWLYGLFLPFLYTVRSQCINGYEETCVWKHDEKSALRWILKTDPDGGTFIQLTGCEHPSCGTASLVTPWLPPRHAASRWTGFAYRVYDTSNVYLRLYLKTEEGGQHQVFSKEGNYAMPFPKEWTVRDVVIPATTSRHRLLLKAHTPYKEAFVAVRNINMRGGISQLSTVLPQATMEGPIEEKETTASLFHAASDNFTDSLTDVPIDFDDEDEDEDEDNEVEKGEESQTEDQYLALEENFIGVEDLIMGFTKVMDPQICKYG